MKWVELTQQDDVAVARWRTLYKQVDGGSTMTRLVQIALGISGLLLSLSVRTPLVQHARADDLRCFAETKQCISGPLLEYWEAHGGIEVFGHPITPPSMERNPATGAAYLIQRFEHNCLRYHPTQDDVGRCS